MGFKKISSKVGTITSLIIFLFGGITCVLTYLSVYGQFSTQSENDFLAINKSNAAIFSETFDHSHLLVKTIANDRDIVNFASGESSSSAAVTDLLNKYNIGNHYSVIYITNTEGVAIVSTDPTFIGSDYSFRPYLKSAISGVSFSDVNIGVTTGKLGFYFSHPIKNLDGNIVAVAVVKLDTAPITELLDRFIGDQTADLMLVDQYGTIVGAYKKHRILSSVGIPSLNFVNKIKSENKYAGQIIKPLQYQVVQDHINKGLQHSIYEEIYDTVDGESENMFISPITDTGFYLVSEVHRDRVISAAYSTAMIISLMIILSVATTIIVLWLLLAKTLSPISSLNNMAMSVGRGNFNVTNNVNTGDELSALGKVIESMAVSLKNRYNDLEEIVSERTKSLESKTKTLTRSQKAIQNLLEDTNDAKLEAENLASDLLKFQKAVEGASDHIVITDPDGFILYANQAVTTLTGYSNREVIGKKAGSPDLWGGQMEGSFYKTLWQTIKIDKKVFSGEITNRRKNGQKYIALASISPILNKDGEVVFFVGIERDATVEREVDRMKTEFVSFASHQLRTPLSAMKWFAEMLLAGDAGKLSKEQKEFVQNIYDSNERMTHLVKDLLDISRIESGRIIIDPKPTDIVSLTKSVLSEVSIKSKQKKQTIITSFNGKLPLINLDTTLIRNVILNLLTNSVKYTPEKGEIIIFISRKSKNVLIQVSDNGYGIPKAQQSQTFQKFFRASNAIRKETEGTGLGLYLVKAIVESSGGKVWFESAEGKGTSFWFSLPINGIPKKEGEITLGS